MEVVLTLREITPENQQEVRALKVQPQQSKFVADVDKSLADAFVWKDAQVRAAYLDDLAIGFVMIFPFEQGGASIINIVRFLVDARFQGKGHGRQFFQTTLDWVGSMSPDTIRISTLPENDAALSLYKSVGFVETGEEDGEVVLELMP